MKKHLKVILSSAAILVFLLFTTFLITLIYQTNFYFYDYALYGILMGVIILTLFIGLVPGLFICAVIIFGYGSVIFFQMITGSGQIWTLHYLWFIIYPLTTFFAGRISEQLKMLMINVQAVVN